MKIGNKEKKVAKAGLLYAISNFFSKGAVYLTIPLFTRLMTTDEMGNYSNVTSWVNLLLPILTLEMVTSMKTARFDFSEEFDRYNSSIAVYGTLITALCYLITLTNFDFFCSLLSVSPFALHMMYIYMMLRPALDIFQRENNIRYKYKSSVAISMGSTVLSLCLALLFVAIFSDKVAGRILGHYGVYILVCIALYVYLIYRGKGISFKYFKYSMTISFPLMWHVLSMHILSSSDRIAIRRFLGAEAVALYSVSYTCSHVISIVYHSLNNAWSPWAMEQMHDGNIEKLKKVSKLYVLLFSAIMFFMLLICPELLWILGGDKYMVAKYVMPPAMIAVIPQFIYALYIDAEVYFKKQKSIALGTGFAALLNIVLNIIFIPLFGYVAAAYTTLIGYTALFVFHYITVKKLGKTDWFNNRFNFTLTLVFYLIIPFFVFLYTYNTIRYIVSGIMVLLGLYIVVKYKEKVKAISVMFYKRKRR